MSADKKIYSEAEKEMLQEVVVEFTRARLAQDKVVAFLRKQHAAPEAEGWEVTLEGLVREVAEAAQ